MAYSIDYSKYIWHDRERDAEAMHACELIYMVKKLSLSEARVSSSGCFFRAAKSLAMSKSLLFSGCGIRYRFRSIAGGKPNTKNSAASNSGSAGLLRNPHLCLLQVV